MAEAGFAALWWIPLFAAVERAPFWMAAWLNRNRQPGSNRAVVRIIEWSGRVPKKGNYLQVEFDPRQPVDRGLLVADVRAVWRSSPVTAFGAVLRMAWELYWAGLLRGEPAVLVRMRDLCLEAFGRATQEQAPIWEWHPVNLDLVRMPKDGSRGEALAASLF